MRIAVFCSSSANIDPDFVKTTAKLGRWAGENGHDIVFGGCGLGLMETVAAAARQAGGRTVGVIPEVMTRSGRASDNVDVTIPCDNLSDRKELMLARADAIVALPGGIGTLDEIFTVAASATVGYHSKPVILYNMKGFWNSLTTFLDELDRQGVLRGDWRALLPVANDLEELKALIGG